MTRSLSSPAGSTDVGPLGKLRTFLSYPHCRVALDLGTDKSYLIMGRSKDVFTDDQTKTYVAKTAVSVSCADIVSVIAF